MAPSLGLFAFWINDLRASLPYRLATLAQKRHSMLQHWLTFTRLLQSHDDLKLSKRPVRSNLQPKKQTAGPSKYPPSTLPAPFRGTDPMNLSQQIRDCTLRDREFYRRQAKTIPMDSYEIALRGFSALFVVACGCYIFLAFPPAALPIVGVLDHILRRG